MRGRYEGDRTRPGTRIAIWILAVLLALTAAALIFLFAVNRFSVDIQLEGETEIHSEYQVSYQDPGARAVFRGTHILKQGIPLEITADHSVDSNTLGTYQVTYSARYLVYENQAERTVIVEDTVSPVITLVSNPDSFTFPGQAYEEEGYSATDNHDGDLTNQVECFQKGEYRYYRVEDSSGNRQVVGRLIRYDDPIPPELTLTGETEITIQAGEAYADPGWSASDNCDGDLTDQVQVSGRVDPYSAGTYTLTYRVEDSYRNEASAQRIVHVLGRTQPDKVEPEGKVIYLTFDDGPGKHTERLLDILDEHNVKATFFVVNSSRNEVMKEIVDRGHSIGMHSMTHEYSSIYASEEAFFRDLLGIQAVIREQTGVESTLMRFPGGSSNTVSRFNPGIMSRLTKDVQDMGFQYFDWNVSSEDAGGAWDSDTVFRNVIDGIGNRKIAVVLQHDIKGFSVDAVDRIINWGLAHGYRFLPLDETSPTAHHGVNN